MRGARSPQATTGLPRVALACLPGEVPVPGCCPASREEWVLSGGSYCWPKILGCISSPHHSGGGSWQRGLLLTCSCQHYSQGPPLGPEGLADTQVHVLSCSCRVRLFATLWPVASQAPLSMGVSRQECYGELPCPPPGDLPHPGVEPVSLVSCIGKRILYR